MDHSQRTLRNLLRVEDAHVIPQLVQVVQQANEVPVRLIRTARPRDERRLLERRTGAGPVCLGRGVVPREVAKRVEQSAGWRPTLGKVVGLRGVDDALPVVVVLHRHEAVVHARELAGELGALLEWLDPGVSGCRGVEDPAGRLVLELVPLSDGAGRGVDGGPPEEDVAVGDGEIEDDLPVGRFVAARRMPLES